eukprot:892662_1
MAEEMAKHFNDALEGAAQHFKPESRKVVEKQIRLIPKMKFLKPFVVETLSDEVEWNFLVEPMLQGDYKKFNDNMGMVRGQSKSVNVENLSSAMGNLSIGNEVHGFGGLGLGVITEEDGEEEDSDDEIIEEQNNTPENGSYSLSEINDALVPQAFSHFSYEKSNKITPQRMDLIHLVRSMMRLFLRHSAIFLTRRAKNISWWWTSKVFWKNIKMELNVTH